MTQTLAKTTDSGAYTEKYQFPTRDYELTLGSRTVKLTVIAPSGSVEPTYQTLLLPPGVVARRRAHAPFGRAMAGLGYQVVLMSHESAAPTDVEEVATVLDALAQGEFVDADLADEVVPIGHSYGAGRTVLALQKLHERDTQFPVRRAVLQAPACFGGVRSRNLLDSATGFRESFAGEVQLAAQMRDLEAIRVAASALAYITQSRQRIVHELMLASTTDVIDATASLIEKGVAFGAIIHPDDTLINPALAMSGLEKAGVSDIVELNCGTSKYKATHNAQLFHPTASATAADAMLRRIGLVTNV